MSQKWNGLSAKWNELSHPYPHISLDISLLVLLRYLYLGNTMDLETFTAKPGEIAELFAVQGERRVDRRATKHTTMAPLPKHQPGERFIRGPIPLAWFKAAAKCGERAEAISVLLWYAAGYQRRNPVKLTPTILKELNVHPKTARRVLVKMAELRLVDVVFHRGRSPLVTITTPGPAVSME